MRLIDADALIDRIKNPYEQAQVARWVNEQPTIEPEKRTEERTETHACDLISRQAAIDAVNSHFGFSVEEEYGSAVQEVLNDLPSAQPEKAQLSREDTTSDYISRQAAIDAMEQAKEQYFDRRVIIGKMQDIVSNLPAAQHNTDYSDGYADGYKQGMKDAQQEQKKDYCPNCGAYMRGEQE